MNNEIKEKIPFNVRDVLENINSNILWNYITNLQQELQEANDSVEWWSNRFKAVERDNRELTQENEELKKKLDRRYYKNEYERIKQENEELKKNQRYYKNGVFSLEYDKETLSDMIDDYKSRCEKASDNLKRNYWINEHEHNDDVVNMTLNILQNGSEDNVSDRD